MFYSRLCKHNLALLTLIKRTAFSGSGSTSTKANRGTQHNITMKELTLFSALCLRPDHIHIPT